MATSSVTITVELEQLAPYWDGLALWRVTLCLKSGRIMGVKTMLAPIMYERWRN